MNLEHTKNAKSPIRGCSVVQGFRAHGNTYTLSPPHASVNHVRSSPELQLRQITEAPCTGYLASARQQPLRAESQQHQSMSP